MSWSRTFPLPEFSAPALPEVDRVDWARSGVSAPLSPDPVSRISAACTRHVHHRMKRGDTRVSACAAFFVRWSLSPSSPLNSQRPALEL